MKTRLAKPCPCGHPALLSACCGPLIAGERPAMSAESLMRSRYSAYSTGAVDYLRETWHASTRPADLDLVDNPRWIGLSVIRTEATGADSAIVEFTARYRVGGRAHRLHEISRFIKEDGRWYYLDGDIQPD